MPSGTVIQRCTPYPGDRWVCSYIVWLKCGCRYDRFTITLKKSTKPTDEEILKAIANGNKN